MIHLSIATGLPVSCRCCLHLGVVVIASAFVVVAAVGVVDDDVADNIILTITLSLLLVVCLSGTNQKAHDSVL